MFLELTNWRILVDKKTQIELQTVGDKPLITGEEDVGKKINTRQDI